MVAGRNIGEMVYIDKEIDTEINREGWIQMGGTSINPALPVAKNERDIPGDTLPYWPNYEDIQPAHGHHISTGWKADGQTRNTAWVTFSCTSTE